MSEMAYTIGERIRTYRNRAGLTQLTLAELAGVHPTYVGQLERGEKNASLDTIVKLTRALDLPFETLFESIAADGDVNNNIAREIYDIVSARSLKEQRMLLEMVKKMIEFKG